MMTPGTHRPPGVWASTGFFVVAGVMQVALGLADHPQGLSTGTWWDVIGRSLMNFLLAWGLWHRLALCRQIAWIACVASLLTYAAALGLALGQAPLRYPPSVVIGSLVEVPSCALLAVYLRSPAAVTLFSRPLASL